MYMSQAAGMSVPTKQHHRLENTDDDNTQELQPLSSEDDEGMCI